ncbi:MAG: type II restriction endonuclease [Nitrospirae bacterium]|nr:type II restriction endonuclease [Nitrospirota bacterium]
MKTLEKRHGKEREMRQIPVALSNGKEIKLLPGRQNVLVKKVLDNLCSLYTPAGRVLYVSDTKEKWSYFDPNALRAIGVEIEEHGKMPDVVVHHVEKDWLVLIEAVTSHGPVNPKRRQELKELFAGAKIGLVFVTAFLERRAMIKYLNDISWETEAWFAESPTHLLHFNGKRFLGPYED